ncbi:MAG TPA: CcdB family protein [Acetobacteraceae bacterium]|jgi:toxin CcdB
MQHDLFVNPSRRGRAIYPLLVDLQADIVGGESRIVAPLTTTAIVPNPPTRVLPRVMHDGQGYVVMMRLLGFLPARQLGSSIGSIAQHRDDISRALDWLFFGI